MEYYDGIYEALVNHADVPVSAEDGMNVISIIEAAMKSNKEKKVISL